MPPTIFVRNLSKRYINVDAVGGITFSVENGEIFGLLGPNGGGKSTTIECIVGLRRPDEGTIELFGKDTQQNLNEVKQKIGAVLQTTSLQDKITPREALRLFGSLYRESISPQALLERFSLTEKADAAFDTLSGGQQQRLALALALVNNPEMIVLDEPTTGLDPQSRRDLHAEIQQMKCEGRTVLITTHNIEEAEQLCDRIAILNHGRIVATGEPRKLMAQSTRPPSVFFATTPLANAGELQIIPGISGLRPEGSGYRLSVTGQLSHMIRDLMKFCDDEHLVLSELNVQKATLEDVLIELTSDAHHE